MVSNEKLILHEMMVLITSARGEGSDEPACTHDLARALAFRINEVCKFRHLVSLKTPEKAIIRGFFGYAMIPNLMFVCPFLMIKILSVTLVPLNSNW